VAVDAPAAPRVRSPLRSVALPTEHGGWGLTAEPVLLGLLVRPSMAGLALGLAAVVAFLARTPLRVALVDQRRARSLPRTRLARRVLAAELAVLAALVAVAAATAAQAFWWPVLGAAPLGALDLWFERRSRSRRLVPELAGSVAVCAVAAMIVLAGGGTAAVAVGAWLILAARAATAIPHVRAQIARLHGRPVATRTLLAGDVAALAASALAVAVDRSLAPGALAVATAVALHRRGAHRPVPPPKVIGLRQTAMGLVIVAVTAAGIHVT
jgi:hypothetical protein